MFSEIEFTARRFEVFAEQVLAPAVYSQSAKLAVLARQCDVRLDPLAALNGQFHAVMPGWNWGPLGSTCWFRLQGVVPQSLAGQVVALRFSSATEALLWRDRTPFHGLGPNHDAPLLLSPAAGGESLDLLVEAACNRPLGATFFWWDHAEERRRFSEPLPGRLEYAELAAFDERVWRLLKAYEFACQRLRLLQNDDERARRLIDGLDAATRAIDDRKPSTTADAARAAISSALAGDGASSASRCIAVGHAHIDTAWLWTTAETRRKCARTFATILRLMERYPQFRFTCSQAQQYEWLEQDAPALFRQIETRVREGRWEPIGGMWVEPDCNLPSGESLIRQIQVGSRYFESRFGDHAPHRVAFLPDTFGFPASLPQILRSAGFDTFVTNKLCWNDHTEFPHVTFVWRGIDGSEIVSHQMPGRDYNAVNTPAELARGEANAARCDQSRAGVWLQPFGYGDGGGGPTDTSIEFAHLAQNCNGLPRVEFGRVAEFCDALHARRAELRAAGREFPVWDGELYLENHRATYTTHAGIKQKNRRIEDALREAEWLCAWSTGADLAQHVRDETQISDAWNSLLRNQFHDILPGSSIADVYRDAHAELDAASSAAERAANDARERLLGPIDASPAIGATATVEDQVVVFNPASTVRAGVVDCNGELRWIAPVSPLSAAKLSTGVSELPVGAAVSATAHELENEHLRVRIDAEGRIAELLWRDGNRVVNARSNRDSLMPLNQLALFEDHPRYFEAWDIDIEHESKRWLLDAPCERIELVQADALRGVIETERVFGASRIVQRYQLDAGAQRVDVHTRLDWHERKRLMRALFPVAVRARRATYEIAFGHIERPTHRNTAADRAMFEVCAHRWMDLSQPDFGVALLNNGRFGHSCHDNCMGLTLARGPTFPDPSADLGAHEFTYSLMPHGPWPEALTRVHSEAEALNRPLRCVRRSARGAACAAPIPAPLFEIEGSGFELASTRAVQDGQRLIVRLVEISGQNREWRVRWRSDVSDVQPLDLCERSCALRGFTHDSAQRHSVLRVQPFQIVTLGAERRNHDGAERRNHAGA